MSNALLFGSSLSLLFAVLLLLLSNGCLCQNFYDCPNASCGTLFSNISYPFGLANSGCGHPAFQIHCVSGKPHLAINGVNYTVLDHKNNTLTVVNDGVFSNPLCPFPHGAVNLTASPFMVAPSYNTNLTLFLGCSFFHLPFLDLGCSVDNLRYDWNYTPPPSVLLGDCKVIQVPVRVSQYLQDIIDKVLQGFEILWNGSGEMFRKCRACEKKKGICGFNFTVSGVFVCSVPEKPNSTINGSSSDLPKVAAASPRSEPEADLPKDKSYTAIIIALLFGSSLSLLFAVLLLLLSNGCLCQNFSDCPNASCGTLFSNISYPSGLANSGCGHPAFQIHCVFGKPHLAINGVNYTVIDHKNNTLTVVNDEVFSNLPRPIPHGAINLTASPFMVAPSYNTNLTLFLGCSFIHLPFLDLGCSVDNLRYDWNYTPPPSVLLGNCKTIQVPIRVPQFEQDIIDKVLQGFEILWNESGEMFRKCRACEKRKGICGFNFTVSGVFVCSVPGKPNSTINGSSSGM